MADTFVQGRKLYVGGRDLSGDAVAIALRGGRATIPFTRMSDETDTATPGLRQGALEASGRTAFGTDLSDEELNGFVDLADVPIIVAPTTGLYGEPAYGFLAEMGDFTPMAGAQVGEPLDYSVSARTSDSKLVRGTMMEDGATARTVTFTGTSRQLGAISATQKLYAQIQCFSASAGDTLDVIVRSDDGTGMATPTTRVTFDQISASGSSEWVEVAGAITDDWWDISATIAGNGSESFTFVVLLAIA